MDTEVTVGSATAPLLEGYGVECIFGIPGNHTIELYRGLQDTGIRHITTRHEQGAAFMADGYARVSGQPGVCFVISGPGLLNAAAAITQANQDCTPVLVITSISSAEPASGALHQMPDQSAVAGALGRASFTVTRPAELSHAISQAFQLMHTRPGAVVVQIPTDVQAMPAANSKSAKAHTPQDNTNVAELAALLDAATHPLLLIGGGARKAQGVAELAERLDCPVLNTVNGKGVVPYGHPLVVGGSPSLPCLKAALADADVVLALGTEFSETDYDLLMDAASPPRGRVVQVNQAPVPEPGIQADAGEVIEALNVTLKWSRRNGAPRAQALRQSVRHEPHYHPDFAAFFHAIQAAADDLILVGDSTRPTYYAAWMYETQRPGRYFHSASGFGTLGYAIPAAFGAKLATDLPVVALIGDGGAQFTLTELATAVDNQIGVPVIIWLNKGYEEIAHSLSASDVSGHSTDITSPDFAMIASAYGCLSFSPTSVEALTDAIRQSLTYHRPSLILVKQDDFVHSASGEWYG